MIVAPRTALFGLGLLMLGGPLGCSGGNSPPTAPGATATPIPVLTASPNPTPSPSPTNTPVPCQNLSGSWESDWSVCTLRQPDPGPGVIVSQSGCTLTASIPQLGAQIRGTVSGSGPVGTSLAWTITFSGSPCTGQLSGTSGTDLSAIFLDGSGTQGWDCVGGCSARNAIVALRR